MDYRDKTAKGTHAKRSLPVPWRRLVLLLVVPRRLIILLRQEGHVVVVEQLLCHHIANAKKDTWQAINS